MKKQIPVIILLILIVQSLSAQNSTDIIYLKNGNKVFGKLLEISDNLYKIRTANRSVFIFQSSEIERYVNELAISDTLKYNKKVISLEAGVLAGAQSSKYDAAFSFSILASLVQNKFNRLNLGSGVEFLGESYLPLFLEYKLNLSDRKTTPFLFIRGGKLLHINGDFATTDQVSPAYLVPMSYKGGFSFTLGTGISWTKDGYETYLSVAYRNANTSYTETDNTNQIYTYKTAYNRLEIKYGFRF